jgi:hypothetical protein
MLTYRDRGAGGTQLDVMSGSLNICFLRMASQSTETRGEIWEWSWHVWVGPPGFQIHGRASSKHEAEKTIEGAWQQWVAAAGLRVQ